MIVIVYSSLRYTSTVRFPAGPLNVRLLWSVMVIVQLPPLWTVPVADEIW